MLLELAPFEHWRHGPTHGLLTELYHVNTRARLMTAQGNSFVNNTNYKSAITSRLFREQFFESDFVSERRM